jgi:hypothetical protein
MCWTAMAGKLCLIYFEALQGAGLFYVWGYEKVYDCPFFSEHKLTPARCTHSRYLSTTL